ncbi:MAG TPA: crosslink repair DNA glycosylase YcaQ family protein [Gemmatimonadaceae bacterium]
MTESKLRAWWWHRQGLDGSLKNKTPAAILAQSGWARSVGGVGPYLALFARGQTSRAAADAAVAKVEIHELPSARGCTYVLPASDYALALTVAQPFGEADMRTAAKLGVTEKEIEKLCDAVVVALSASKEPLDPEAIKQATGKAVRNLGEDGKKKGMITTLPVALGRLQTRGEIRRVPVGGRLDQQRYKYVRWSPNPLAKSKLSTDDAYVALAREFFRAVGPATMKEFQWYSGLGVKAAKDAVATLGLVAAEPESDRLLLPDDAKTFAKFITPTDPQYALVSSLDAIAAARRDVSTLVDAKDRAAFDKITFGEKAGANLSDLVAHAIFDRGRLIGYWEFDAETQEVVWMVFTGKKTKDLARVVEETETYVRDQLGDARSFSLDSPKSRAPKIAALRKLS